jgi:hypothetical protein
VKLSPKQRVLLARAAAGEDRQLPGEQPRRWYVPPGLLVPSGSNEYQAAYALRARGLLKMGGVPPSSDLPYGQGGYLITAKGRKLLTAITKGTKT